MVEVVVENLSRRFGSAIALDDVSFTVASGEFLTLLGPSGCGKSTTLNALAGLDQPTGGSISIDGVTVFDAGRGIFVDAQHRRLGLMFQSYALWPHMTVYQNLDFALELNRIRGEEARKRIAEVLELVDMAGYDARYPGELSGGQQQRIALARTMVYRPKMLLLDEPLSNLDAKLRDRARIWLAEIQRKSGMTTVFVTHDQAEALSLSDRIIVMSGGKIAQIGTPREIYDSPANAFVADFVGASNVFAADVIKVDGTNARMRLAGGAEIVGPLPPESAGEGARVTVSVRPEAISFSDVSREHAVACEVLSKSYLGARTLIVARAGEQQIRVELGANEPTGDFLHIPPQAVRTFA